MNQAPLLVHVIFHPSSEDARALARDIHKALNSDPAVPGLRIPTVVCPTDGDLPPAEYKLDEAERNFVVVLADAHVVDRNSAQVRKWSTFIGDLWEVCERSVHRFFPVQLDQNVSGFDDRLGGTNFLRAFGKADKESRDNLVIRRVVIELCRHLQWSPQGLSALRTGG